MIDEKPFGSVIKMRGYSVGAEGMRSYSVAIVIIRCVTSSGRVAHIAQSMFEEGIIRAGATTRQ